MLASIILRIPVDIVQKGASMLILCYCLFSVESVGHNLVYGISYVVLSANYDIKVLGKLVRHNPHYIYKSLDCGVYIIIPGVWVIIRYISTSLYPSLQLC